MASATRDPAGSSRIPGSATAPWTSTTIGRWSPDADALGVTTGVRHAQATAQRRELVAGSPRDRRKERSTRPRPRGSTAPPPAATRMRSDRDTLSLHAWEARHGRGAAASEARRPGTRRRASEAGPQATPAALTERLPAAYRLTRGRHHVDELAGDLDHARRRAAGQVALHVRGGERHALDLLRRRVGR